MPEQNFRLQSTCDDGALPRPSAAWLSHELSLTANSDDLTPAPESGPMQPELFRNPRARSCPVYVPLPIGRVLLSKLQAAWTIFSRQELQRELQPRSRDARPRFGQRISRPFSPS